MKKLLSVILVLVMIAVCGASLAEEGKARTQFWIPKDLAEIKAEIEDLPVSEFPVVKTKTADGLITVTVDPTPDSLYANWMGYGEEPEEVRLTDGQGVISQEGHKYQLGARYVNSGWKNWLGGYDYMEEGANQSFSDAVAYFSEYYAEDIAAGARIENEPFQGYYVYYTHNSYYYTDEGEWEDWHQVGEYVWEQVGGRYETREEAEAAAEALGGMNFTMEESEEYNATVYTTDGYNWNREGGYAWLYTMEYGHSRGWPNRAYTLTTGEYSIDYTRAGVPYYASRTTEGLDFFETGIEGAVSTVNWEIRTKSNLLLSIKTVYPEGSDIASIILYVPSSGNFYRYRITYNTGEGEQYIAIYTAKDELCKAYYVKDGETVAANSSATKWINCETAREERFLEPLNGDLLGHPAHRTTK